MPCTQVSSAAAPRTMVPAKITVTAIGRTRATRVTSKDISKNGGVKHLIDQLVMQSIDGDAEAKEGAAMMLSSLAAQNHGEHLHEIFNAGAMQPLVRILSSGSAKAQESAAKALSALVQGQESHQEAMVQYGSVPPLVRLLKSGSAKVQEEVTCVPLLPAPDDACKSPLASPLIRLFFAIAGCICTCSSQHRCVAPKAYYPRGWDSTTCCCSEGRFCCCADVCSTSSGQCCHI
jgi:hypothetical protein